VFLRVDYNVPLRGTAITDDTRIRATLPTIEYLLAHHAAVIIASHLGRPKGTWKEELSLAPVAHRLSELLHQPVEMAPDCVGSETEAMARSLQPGQLIMLENLRFHPEEEANDQAFAGRLASLADLYVDDAFGAAHRAHASTEAIAHLLPAAAGLLMEREIEALSGALHHAQPPFIAVIGGAKISTKMALIENLLTRVDALIIGGGMANTFLAAKGYEVGSSLVEADLIPMAKELLGRASADRLLLPVDVVVAPNVSSAGQRRTVAVDQVPPDWTIVDAGSASLERFCERIHSSRTVLWNGPMGIFEEPAFAAGTLAIGRCVAASQAESIVGGGDSVAALDQMGLTNSMSHVSTGGGATLEFLEGKTLPGIAVLEQSG